MQNKTEEEDDNISASRISFSLSFFIFFIISARVTLPYSLQRATSEQINYYGYNACSEIKNGLRDDPDVNNVRNKVTRRRDRRTLSLSLLCVSSTVTWGERKIASVPWAIWCSLRAWNPDWFTVAKPRFEARGIASRLVIAAEQIQRAVRDLTRFSFIDEKVRRRRLLEQNHVCRGIYRFTTYQTRSDANATAAANFTGLSRCRNVKCIWRSQCVLSEIIEITEYAY